MWVSVGFMQNASEIPRAKKETCRSGHPEYALLFLKQGYNVYVYVYIRNMTITHWGEVVLCYNARVYNIQAAE